MKSLQILVLFLPIFLLSGASKAGDLLEADPLLEGWNDRGLSFTHAKGAHKSHVDAIQDGSLQGEDLFDGIDKVGKLSVLLGELARDVYEETEEVNKELLYKECRDLTDFIKPGKKEIGDARYYYWRAICLALRLDHSDLGYKLRFGVARALEIKELIDAGLAEFRGFDGGGFLRLQAAINIRSKNFKIANLYKPKKAKMLLLEAVEYGPLYFINYLFLAECMVELGETQEAIELLTEKAQELEQRIADNSLPEEISGVENDATLKRLNRYLAHLNKAKK